MGDGQRAGAFGRSLGDALGTPDLRRLWLSWGASAVGGWVFFVTLAVYAYDAGGPAAVGAAALARMVPAGLAAPVTGLIADRHSRRDVMAASILAQATMLGAMAAAVAASLPIAVVLVLAALFTIAATAHRPAQASLLPQLARTAAQLGASNAVWSAIDNVAFLLGSLAGGALIAGTSVHLAMLLDATVFALAALPLLGIARDPVPEYRAAEEDDQGPLRDLADGFGELLRHPGLRLIVGFQSLSTFIEGMIDVLVVVVAIELLGLGGEGVGWLNAAWALGGVAGGAVAAALLQRGRLAAGLAFGGVLIGAPLAAIAVLGGTVATCALLALVGIGYSLIEVAGMSLLQRLTSEDVLARAFGVVESSYWMTTGLGAIVAPALVSLLGVRGALVAAGAVLPLVALLRWSALNQFESGAEVPERPFRTLRAISLFAPLPIATVENVARRVSERWVAPGEVVIREGEAGDSFYVVAEGVLDVSCGGGRFDPVADGDYFGEIALLRDVPRTATVTARRDTLLYALDRDSFLGALGAHRAAGRTVRRVADTRFNNAPVA